MLRAARNHVGPGDAKESPRANMHAMSAAVKPISSSTD
jgi:hypothetical protein